MKECPSGRSACARSRRMAPSPRVSHGGVVSYGCSRRRLDLRVGSNPYVGGVSTYTIGETARRSGFSASALRFYEDIGLVDPAGRTEAGYRLYDDGSLQRLAFIARAKQLGCSLEEITDLVGIRDGHRCGPVQRRFHDLVTAKIRDAETQVDELTGFAAQLRASAERLAGDPVDGPCGPGCACLAVDPGRGPVEPAPVPFGRPPVTVAGDIPIACSLEPGAMASRRTEWVAVLDGATRRTATDGGVRIELARDVDLGELGRLIGAEQHCCAFLRFTLTVDADGTALDVRAPEMAADLVSGLFGSAG
jgi:MerR family copper efflux transcriptional regulator